MSQFQRMKLSVPGEKLNRQGLLGLTAEGSLLLLSPFWDEAMFKRMASLQVWQAKQTSPLHNNVLQEMLMFDNTMPLYPGLALQCNAACTHTHQAALGHVVAQLQPRGTSIWVRMQM